MRTGFLTFGETLDATAPLLDGLRESDIDVVASLDEPATIRDQSLRLGRADCDGVIFAVGAGADSLLVAEAALHVGCPILLIGDSNPAQVEAWNLLTALPLLFDALSPTEATPERVLDWLYENGKTPRQCGEEAIARLYGTRLFTGLEGGVAFHTKVSWLTQFGILVSNDAMPGDPRESDLSTEDGTPTEVLTRRLLELVSGSPKVLTIERGSLASRSRGEGVPPFTFALIEEYSPRRYCAFVFSGGLQDSGGYSIGALPSGTLNVDSKATHVFAVEGDFVGAMRVACHTLDISVRILHDK